MAQAELEAETNGAVSIDLIERAAKRIALRTDIELATLENFVDKAKSAGFLKNVPELSRLVVQP